MKIGLVLSRPPGGSETFFRNKIIALQKKGIAVELFVEKADPAFRLCVQHTLPSKKWMLPFEMLRTFCFHPVRSVRFLQMEFRVRTNRTEILRNYFINLHLLKSSRLDWIHFGFATMAVGRENIAKATGARMALSIRGFDISRYPLRHPGIYRLAWLKADKVHTISNALLQKALVAGMPRHLAYSRITPAIDHVMFKRNAVSGINFPLRFLTVARLHWSKGLEYTIQALALLNSEGIDFIFTIAGDGKDHERLVLAAHQYGISSKIVFAGAQEHNRLPEFYNNCDIYLQYSVQEGFCNAVLEAQAMGLLCIVSDAEGLPENVIHEETGWVVPRRNPPLLAQQIMKVISQESSGLDTIRNNAQQRVKSSFNLEKQAMEFVNFYNGN